MHDNNPYTKKWTVIRKNMGMIKIHMNMDSHSYRNVHDENPYTMKWVVICTEMCMTKTHTKTYTNMDIQGTKLYKPKTNTPQSKE